MPKAKRGVLKSEQARRDWPRDRGESKAVGIAIRLLERQRIWLKIQRRLLYVNVSKCQELYFLPDHPRSAKESGSVWQLELYVPLFVPHTCPLLLVVPFNVIHPCTPTQFHAVPCLAPPVPFDHTTFEGRPKTAMGI